MVMEDRNVLKPNSDVPVAVTATNPLSPKKGDKFTVPISANKNVQVLTVKVTALTNVKTVTLTSYDFEGNQVCSF